MDAFYSLAVIKMVDWFVWAQDYTMYSVCNEHIRGWLFILVHFYIYLCIILATFFDLNRILYESFVLADSRTRTEV